MTADALWTNGAMVLRLTGRPDHGGHRDCYAYSPSDNCRYLGSVNPLTNPAIKKPSNWREIVVGSFWRHIQRNELRMVCALDGMAVTVADEDGDETTLDAVAFIARHEYQTAAQWHAAEQQEAAK